MYALMDALEGIGDFINMGGEVLKYCIVPLLLLLWTLIFERVWYFKTSLKGDVQAAIDTWEERAERRSKRAHQVREAIISRVSIKIDENMTLIKTLVALAPLFGLMGTVWGMINVFDIMGITGGGDAKSMASGVFKATIPTMSGMVTAISGVFGYTYLDRVTAREKSLLEDHLTMDH
ncbi:MotA/TolQ/ExbB proton channel family protein [Porticoccaceae bacterium LTM1]|nr:MotA/TolQ/ExbB proton channel family protein [Porticoccaceae bacterium LTM1]